MDTCEIIEFNLLKLHYMNHCRVSEILLSLNAILDLDKDLGSIDVTLPKLIALLTTIPDHVNVPLNTHINLADGVFVNIIFCLKYGDVEIIYSHHSERPIISCKNKLLDTCQYKGRYAY